MVPYYSAYYLLGVFLVEYLRAVFSTRSIICTHGIKIDVWLCTFANAYYLLVRFTSSQFIYKNLILETLYMHPNRHVLALRNFTHLCITIYVWMSH